MMMKKGIVRFLAGAVATLCLLVSIGPVNNLSEVQAATKKISKSDFSYIVDKEKASFYTRVQDAYKREVTNYDKDRFSSKKDAKEWFDNHYIDYLYFSLQSKEQIKIKREYTLPRGIELGDNASKVANKFGKTKKISYNQQDAFDNYVVAHQPSYNVTNLSYYYEYQMDNTDYSIRFYFTNKDILQNMVYTYSIDNLAIDAPYYNAGKYPVKLKSGQKVTQKTYAGNTYYVFPKNATTKTVTPDSNLAMDLAYTYISIYDKYGKLKYKSDLVGLGAFSANSNLFDCIYKPEYYDATTSECISTKTIKNYLSNSNNYSYIVYYIDYTLNDYYTRHDYYRIKFK